MIIISSGYGHATRVSAFSRHLRSLKPPPTLYVVSSAPRHVFNDCIDVGTVYRYANIDPVVIQPIAYRVDRRKSVDALQLFLSKKETLVGQEKQWLTDIGADCVLTDAAFLGCLVARASRLPSVLITNFTFDSVYSYLGTLYNQNGVELRYQSSLIDEMVPDEPVSNEEILPLVTQIHEAYCCADLLVRLPGFIPIPSFFSWPRLPASSWTDQQTNELLPEILHHLNTPLSQLEVYDTASFSQACSRATDSTPSRRFIMDAPLLVRAITTSPESVYTQKGRSHFLTSLGVPEHLHDPKQTRVLVVSFGGQVFRKPSSGRSSRSGTGNSTPENGTPPDKFFAIKQEHGPVDYARVPSLSCGGSDPSVRPITSSQIGRLATQSHLYIPGAPPATKPETCTSMKADPYSKTSAHDHLITASPVQEARQMEYRLLPDSSWIAIVCGVSKQQWGEGAEGDELPGNFFVAPNHVYMPDLTAIADVLLGKLGYGTVSECVDSCTPFVYVPRPLFVEEHGLKLLLFKQGVAVELSREAYEIGDWACAVEEAWLLGRDAKMRMRERGMSGIHLREREEKGRALASDVTNWVRAWHGRRA